MKKVKSEGYMFTIKMECAEAEISREARIDRPELPSYINTKPVAQNKMNCHTNPKNYHSYHDEI